MDERTRQRLRALEERVRRLEATNAVLVDLLGKSEVEAELRRRAKKVTEPVDADDESLDEPRETDTAAMRGSVYRGVSPSAAAGALVCGVCRRPLEPDDPEIVLGEAGRVCVLCSQRERR